MNAGDGALYVLECGGKYPPLARALVQRMREKKVSVS